MTIQSPPPARNARRSFGRYLTDLEMDCLLADRHSDQVPSCADANCICHLAASLTLTRGMLPIVYISLRRRWRVECMRIKSTTMAEPEPENSASILCKWLTTTLKLLFSIDFDSACFDQTKSDAEAYQTFLSRCSKGVRKVYSQIPYAIGLTLENHSSTPELEEALAIQRQERFNVWNEELATKRSKPNEVDGDDVHEAVDESIKEPLKNLRFSVDLDVLSDVKRCLCEPCGHRVFLYCTICHVWVLPEGLLPNPPKIALPMNITIIAKPKEWASKCTAVHACVVAPEHASLLKYPSEMGQIDAFDRETTLILYPNETALDMQSAAAVEPLRAVRNLIVVDSTCSGARQIMRHPALQGLRSVALKSRHTTFWKFTHHGPEFLGTIEAIWYFLYDHHRATSGGAPYDGRYDDLMLLYMHQLNRVQTAIESKDKIPLAWS